MKKNGEDCKHNSPPAASSQHSLITWGTFFPQQTSMASTTLCTVLCGVSRSSPLGRHICSLPFPNAPCMLYCRLPHSTFHSTQLCFSPCPCQNLPSPGHALCSQGNPHCSSGLYLTQEAAAMRKEEAVSSSTVFPPNFRLLRQSTIHTVQYYAHYLEGKWTNCVLSLVLRKNWVGRWADMACHVLCFVTCQLCEYQREPGWWVLWENELSVTVKVYLLSPVPVHQEDLCFVRI